MCALALLEWKPTSTPAPYDCMTSHFFPPHTQCHSSFFPTCDYLSHYEAVIFNISRRQWTYRGLWKAVFICIYFHLGCLSCHFSLVIFFSWLWLDYLLLSNKCLLLHSTIFVQTALQEGSEKNLEEPSWSHFQGTFCSTDYYYARIMAYVLFNSISK